MSDIRQLILTTHNHPLNFILPKVLPKATSLYCELTSPESLINDVPNLHQFDHIFDFTLFPGKQKLQFVKKLSEKSSASLFSESACHWGERLLQEIPSLGGLFSTAFLGEDLSEQELKKKEYFFEYYVKITPEDHQKTLLNFFASIPLTGIAISQPGIGFYLPRVLSMIINEAYFALNENLASSEHIDRAMRFGVNYPLGPLAWAKKIGVDKVALLLNELWDITKDPRYRLAPNLRLESEHLWPFME